MKEQVIELAKQAGMADAMINAPMSFALLTRFATLVRNAALEQAAQKAFSWNTAMTDTLAKEIRELKDPTP